MDTVESLFVFGEKVSDLLLLFHDKYLLSTLLLRLDLLEGWHGLRIAPSDNTRYIIGIRGSPIVSL